MGRSFQTLRVASFLTSAICCGFTTVSAYGQAAAPDATRPATPTAPSGNWWDQPAPQPNPNTPATGTPYPGRGMPGPYRDWVSDYPGATMNEWVSTSALAARARAMRDLAQSHLNATISRVQSRFEHSEDYQKAATAERQAYNAYVFSRQQVLATLGTDPKYHAIMQLRDELSEKITERRYAKFEAASIDVWLASHGFDRNKLSGDQMITLKAMFEAEQQKAANDDDAPKDDILALATLKLQYASDARAIEVNALNGDDNLKNARQKMIDASKKVSDMRAAFEESIRDNPEVLAARRNLEDARINVIEAEALACSATIASSYAINYSYYLHRNDNGGMYGPYGPNGVYGVGGYATPYWGR